LAVPYKGKLDKIKASKPFHEKLQRPIVFQWLAFSISTDYTIDVSAEINGETKMKK
jgi:hypothetical protein